MKPSERLNQRKYGRASYMAARYGVCRQTWWRWDLAGKIPGASAKTPTGNKLWDIETCDEAFRGNIEFAA